MTLKSNVATGWKSRHLGNCFVVRTCEGWVVTLLHSEGIKGASDFLVPFVMADGQKRPPLAMRLRRTLQSLTTGLGDVRHVGQVETASLLRVPNMGPLCRSGANLDPPGVGNWNGRGRGYRCAGQSGVSYLTVRTKLGWLVLLRSLWGSPCGSYLVPFVKLPFGAASWDPDFFVGPLRWHITHLHGARTIDFEEVERLRGWDGEELLDDEGAV